MAFDTGRAPNAIEDEFDVVGDRFGQEVGIVSFGDKMTAGTFGLGMGALQHVVLIVMEQGSRSPLMLIVATLTFFGKPPGVHVGMTIHTYLRQAQIR